MIASDLVRAATFVLMPFVHEPSTIVAVAAVNGIATGFFRPAVWAGLPNLVTDDEREQATSLLTTVENVAWTLGPALAGLLLAFDGVDVAYWTNAVTFLVSAILVSRIPARSLRSEDRITKGHWRELREGLGLVAGSRPLVTVLVVWGTAAVATACINVAEVIFAKHDLGAGNLGLGLLVSATGVGLVIGSFFAASALSTFGMATPHREPATCPGKTSTPSGSSRRRRSEWKRPAAPSVAPTARSGRAASPTKSESPVRTSHGSSARVVSMTARQQCSGRCPGVWMHRSVTVPTTISAPSSSESLA